MIKIFYFVQTFELSKALILSSIAFIKVNIQVPWRLLSLEIEGLIIFPSILDFLEV